jgi:heptosyltransferase II
MTSSTTLVVAPAWVGDMVMSQPLIAQLAQQDSSGVVDILAPAWTAGLCERLPGSGKVISSSFAHGEFKWNERRKLGKDLAQHHYTRAYVLPNSFKSALVPWFAGIPQRIGYVGEWRYGLLNITPPLDKKTRPRLVDRYFNLAQTGIPETPDPVIHARTDNLANLFESLGLNPQPPILILCPGAEYGPAKRWPLHHFASLARHYLNQDWAVWILGSQKDHKAAEQICSQSAPSVENLCGQTTLAEAIDLMALATAVVTNDSGLMHIAAALDKPMVALFGSSSASFTPPLSQQAVVASLDLACSPCFKRECPLGHLDCLENLLPAQVIERLARFKGLV